MASVSVIPVVSESAPDCESGEQRSQIISKISQKESSSIANNLNFNAKINLCGGTIRFRNRDYFGIPVDLDLKKGETGEVSCTVRTSTKRKRKNQNPLMTRFTVKNLKKLLIEQEAQGAAIDTSQK